MYKPNTALTSIGVLKTYLLMKWNMMQFTNDNTKPKKVIYRGHFCPKRRILYRFSLNKYHYTCCFRSVIIISHDIFSEILIPHVSFNSSPVISLHFRFFWFIVYFMWFLETIAPCNEVYSLVVSPSLLRLLSSPFPLPLSKYFPDFSIYDI